VVLKLSAPPSERLSPRRWARHPAWQRAQPVGAPSAPVESADRNIGGVESPRDPQHPCWRVSVSQRQVRRGPGPTDLPPRTEFVAVGDAHEVAVPRGLKVQAPEPDFESGWEGSELPMECPWPWYSVRITIERAGNELIFSATPLPGAPNVGAESSPDTN
jgi:hypothetical protein